MGGEGRTDCIVRSCPSSFFRAPDSLAILSWAILASACTASFE